MAPIATWGDVAELPIDRPSFRAPAKNEIPSDDDMGFNDPDNILYVNMEAPGLGQRFKERMEELEQMLQLTHQLATIHAGIQVRRRKEEGALPTDDSDDSRWRRSQYRSRVMDVYFNDGVYPWYVAAQTEYMPSEANNTVGCTAPSRATLTRKSKLKKAGSTGNCWRRCSLES